MEHDVFISHSSKDKVAADAVCAALESNGIRCWIAPRDIKPGANWATAILHGIAECRMMVLVFSDHVNASQAVRREVERAVHRGLPIAPIRIQDVMPKDDLEFFLSSSHWMDALTPPLEKHLREFSRQVRGLLEMGGELPGAVPHLSARVAECQSPAAASSSRRVIFALLVVLAGMVAAALIFRSELGRRRAVTNNGPRAPQYAPGLSPKDVPAPPVVRTSPPATTRGAPWAAPAREAPATIAVPAADGSLAPDKLPATLSAIEARAGKVNFITAAQSQPKVVAGPVQQGEPTHDDRPPPAPPAANISSVFVKEGVLYAVVVVPPELRDRRVFRTMLYQCGSEAAGLLKEELVKRYRRLDDQTIRQLVESSEFTTSWPDATAQDKLDKRAWKITLPGP